MLSSQICEIQVKNKTAATNLFCEKKHKNQMMQAI